MDTVPLHGSAVGGAVITPRLRRRWASTRLSSPHHLKIGTHKVCPYLLRKRAVTRPNQVWAMDLTYIRWRGVCAVVDWFSPEGLIVAAVDHHSSAWRSRSACSLWQAGDLPHRPGLGVHVHRLHRRAKTEIDISMDGQGRVAGQCLHRAALAFDQIREALSPRLQTVSVPRWHGPLSDLLKVPTPHLPPDRQTPDQAYFNMLTPMMAAASSRRKST